MQQSRGSGPGTGEPEERVAAGLLETQLQEAPEASKGDGTPEVDVPLSRKSALAQSLLETCGDDRPGRALGD